MLGEKNAIATVAVKDIGRAKKFYEGILGLKPQPTKEPSVAEYQSGHSFDSGVAPLAVAGGTLPLLRREGT